MFKQLTFEKHIFKREAYFGITVISSVRSCKDMPDVGTMDETFSFIT
jgi:hypothetical protein